MRRLRGAGDSEPTAANKALARSALVSGVSQKPEQVFGSMGKFLYQGVQGLPAETIENKGDYYTRKVVFPHPTILWHGLEKLVAKDGSLVDIGNIGKALDIA